MSRVISYERGYRDKEIMSDIIVLKTLKERAAPLTPGTNAIGINFCLRFPQKSEATTPMHVHR